MMPMTAEERIGQLMTDEHRAGAHARLDGPAAMVLLQGTATSDPDIAEFIRWLRYTGASNS
jgi:hypothetical protein